MDRMIARSSRAARPAGLAGRMPEAPRSGVAGATVRREDRDATTVVDRGDL